MLSFKVLSPKSEALPAGCTPAKLFCVKYFVLAVSLDWTTEITHVSPFKADGNSYYVDEQRFGPYAFWHHQRHFKALKGGVELVDIVHYALPFGWLGPFHPRVSG